MQECAGADAAVVRHHDAADARADTRPQQAQPRITLSFQPAQAAARVHHRLTVGLERQPDVRAHQLVRALVAARAARPIASPIPTGRVTIVGKVISTKWVENNYGGSLKMLVESEQGWRVFGTVPSRLGEVLARTEGTLVGSKVAFTAEVTPKEADFGFFSRPTGGAVLTEEHPQAEAPVTLPSDGWASHKKVPAPVVQEQRVAAAQAALEREVHFAPVQADIRPEDLLPKSAPTAAPKLTGLAAMVAAAGYKA